jgi:hypothetical protein|tara:strand:+ start:1845 stop:2564 length:720 start_codon:yes stop_codon:yes gene_type:complete
MKLDRKKLIEMIGEELEAIRLEEFNALHSPSTGKFQGKGKGKAVYSLTGNARDVVGPDTEVPNRGTTTNDGKTVSAKYGANTGALDKQCGKLSIAGKKKKKTRRCKDYPKDYWDKSLQETVDWLCSLDEGQQSPCDKCIQAFLARLRRANAALKSAQDGKEIEEAVGEDKRPNSHYQGSPVDKKDGKKKRKTDKRHAAERRKKIRRDTGVYVEPFSQAEKALLNPNLVEMATKHRGKGK